MAVTRLKRKDRRNKAKAHNRVKRLKQLTRRPVIKIIEGTPVAAATETAASQEEE